MTNLSEFFKRIGMSENTQVEQTEKFLRAVHYNAALSIPYENLDILEGKRISLDPDSPFNKKPIVAIKTPNGRKTVDGNVARTFVGDTLIKEEILSPEALSETLLCDFGIALD